MTAHSPVQGAEPTVLGGIIPGPGSDTSLEDQGKELFRRGLKVLELSSDKFNYNYADRLTVAQKLARNGHRELAIKNYDQFLEDYPDDPDALLGRGVVLSWQKEFVSAIQDLRTVVENHPTYAGAWKALGNTYKWSDRYEAAVDAYREWADLNPDKHEPYLAIAEVYIALNQRDDVHQTLDKALENGADEDRVNAMRIRLRRDEVTGKWSISKGYDQTTLSQNREDWRKYKLRASRKFTKGSLSVEMQRVERFGSYNTALVFDGYYDLATNVYGNLRYLRSPQHDFLPRNDIRAEIFRNFGEGWETSGSYRRMDFNTTEVDIVGVTLAKYIGNWYIKGGLTWSRNNRRDEGFSQSLSFRHYYRGNGDDYWEVSGGLGEDQVNTRRASESVTRTSQSLGAGWTRFWTDRWGTEVSFSYKEPDVEPIRRKFSFSLERRW